MYQIDDQNQLMVLHNYIRKTHDVNNENLHHQQDHHNHRAHQLVQYRHGILRKENEVDGMKTEEENKHMYNKRNVRRDA